MDEKEAEARPLMGTIFLVTCLSWSVTEITAKHPYGSRQKVDFFLFSPFPFDAHLIQIRI